NVFLFFSLSLVPNSDPGHRFLEVVDLQVIISLFCVKGLAVPVGCVRLSSVFVIIHRGTAICACILNSKSHPLGNPLKFFFTFPSVTLPPPSLSLSPLLYLSHPLLISPLACFSPLRCIYPVTCIFPLTGSLLSSPHLPGRLYLSRHRISPVVTTSPRSPVSIP